MTLDRFPYEEQYVDYLLEKETRTRQQFRFTANSPQLAYRKSLIKSLRFLASKLHLDDATVHLAVYLLDMFMDCHDIRPSDLMLASSACLLISAKYVDADQNVPRISQLQQLTDHRNTAREYLHMERLVLEFWRWDLNAATATHFLEHLLPNATAVDPVKAVALQLANLTLSEVRFVAARRSEVAAACAAAARLRARLSPVWPPSLARRSGYQYAHLEPFVQSVLLVAHIAWTPPTPPAATAAAATATAVATSTSTSNSTSTSTDDGSLAAAAAAAATAPNWPKCKLKDATNLANAAARLRPKRQLTRDLKRMYCAV